MNRLISRLFLALSLVCACSGNPFGTLEAEYMLEADAMAGSDTSVQPSYDTEAPFVCVDNDKDNFCANAVQKSEQDCNDEVASIHPGAAEICDSVDQDCDGDVDEATGIGWFLDSDGDGFGDPNKSLVNGCNGASFLVSVGDDCNDASTDVNPDATEVCNGKDDDCDGDVDGEDDSLDNSTQKTWYFDSDGDGFGDEDITLLACEKPENHIGDSTDCDDASASSNPEADEVCDEADNDCDGLSDEGVQTFSYLDGDGDGFGNALEVSVGCGVPVGYVLDKTDCVDSASHTYPGAGEICDGADNDCDSLTDEANQDENLCDDGDELTFDTCDLDLGKCVYEDVEFNFICDIPDAFLDEPGIACGAGVFFDDEDGYGEVVVVEEGVLTIPAADVCAELNAGHTMYVNSYIVQEEVDLAFFWVGGEYVTVSETLHNETLVGTPGNITILFPGLDFNYRLEDVEICQ